jgi:glycosyltransferase involved in cell wall biosynthesis
MLTSEIEAAQDVRPYSIEVVPVDRGWILEKIAGEIAREAAAEPSRYDLAVTTHPSGNAELTFFLPESAWRDDLRNTIRTTYFAHKEDHPAAAALFEEVARKSDCCITSSSKYAEMLRSDGAREVFTIPLGVDSGVFVPKVRIGVVGRTYHTGRKGESLLARSLDVPFVEFVFTGEGWPLPARYYGESDLVEFYQSLDYLLIPSLIEGGPVPMLEALATGCQIIAPSDIGMVRDFPHIPFRRGDAEDLRSVIQREVDRRLALRAAALPCDWRHFARRHLELFAQLIERRRSGEAGLPSAITRSVHPRQCRALLLTHGAEDTAKGGPTTRVHNIVAHLRARGAPVEAARDPRALAANRYDVVHVFNCWPPDSALATLVAAKRSGARVVFSPIALDLADWPLFHPFMEKLFQSRPSEENLHAALAAIRAATPPRRYAGKGVDVPVEGLPGMFEKLRLCCDLADQLVLLSEYERAYLGAIGARIDHGVIIRNGVDVDTMQAADPELFRVRFGLDRYVLCVGRIEYRKNQALAAMAMRDMDVAFVLVGAAGDAGYLNHVHRLGGRNLRVLDRIEERSLLASAYAGAAAFLFPSWTEGAPLAAMEAGAAGTPLVLGEMSSEREYFGSDARYVHPTDVGEMGAAVRQLLTHPEESARREERAGRLASDFSIARHAEDTWALYERLHAAGVGPRSLVIDVSALLHFVRVRQPLTGVPFAERHILRELAVLDPALRGIVYNDVKGRFIEIGLSDLDDFDEGRFNSRYWFTADENEDVDRRASLEFADHSTPMLPHAVTCSSHPPPRFKTRTIVLAKQAMQRAPRLLRDPVIALLQRLRPGFDPYQMPSGYRRLESLATETLPLPQVVEPAKGGVPRFEHALGTLLVQEAPRRRPVVSAGARLLTLGQSWLSNGPLLDEMVRLVETRALSLEPYVYDLTYHTGAHQTGWGDNDERFARLLKLLRHSQLVFTESRQVEDELQKLCASRGFAYRTRRTRLRGRDLPEVGRRDGAPSYRPDTFVLVISSFNRRKNHDFLIRVWSDLFETWIEPASRDFRLVLVGQVQEEQKFGDPAFRDQLRRSNIDVHTDLPDSALARLMRDCAFTAYPSLREGWGLPAQESLMCGKVCLLSSLLPVAQEIANPALVRIAPDDFYGWHEALRTWLENAPMRRAFSDRAREYSAPSWREIANAIAFRE